MQPVNLRSFRAKARNNKRRFRRFLTYLEKKTPKKMEAAAAITDKAVWAEIDCLTCANCCKTMTPTYTKADIRRIAAHFGQTPEAFIRQWLKKDRAGDYVNRSLPCQFLNLEDNKCSIYDVRPADCAGFPHLPRKC